MTDSNPTDALSPQGHLQERANNSCYVIRERHALRVTMGKILG